LNCGSASCFAGECKQPADTIDLQCGHCSATVKLSSQGKASTLPPAPQKRPRDGAGTDGPHAKAQRVETARSAVRAAPVASASVATSSASLPSGGQAGGDRCCKVLVGGEKYTCLAWYLQISQPYPRHRRALLKNCKACKFALQMIDGDGKTLAGRGFAKSPPLHARELLAEGDALSFDRWTKSTCGVRLKRCRKVGDLGGKLFRVQDLLKIKELSY
jgi:hypothetical protein